MIVSPDGLREPWDLHLRYDGALTSLGPENWPADGRKASVASISIPQTVTSLKPGAFEAFSNLRTVVLPEGVLSIQSRAFAECASLEEVVFPDTIQSIATDVFAGCLNLKRVVVPAGFSSLRQVLLTSMPNAQDLHWNVNTPLILDEGETTILGIAESPQKVIRVPPAVRSVLPGAFGCAVAELVIIPPQTQIEDIADILLTGRGIKALRMPLRLVTPLRRIPTVQTLELTDIAGKVLARFHFAPSLREDVTGARMAESSGFHIPADYEALFDRPIPVLDRIEMAISRLEYPFQLHKMHRQRYTSFLTNHITELVDYLTETDSLKRLSTIQKHVQTHGHFYETRQLVEQVEDADGKAFLTDTVASAMKNAVGPAQTSPHQDSAIRRQYRLQGIKKGMLVIRAYTGSARSISLPTQFRGQPIRIFDARGSYSAVETLVIPSGFTTILAASGRNRPWYRPVYTGRLRALRIAATVSIIEMGAFENFCELETVQIEEGVRELGPAVFRSCRKLKLVELPGSLEQFGDPADQTAAQPFADCPLVIIHAPAGSRAISFAKAMGIPYVEIQSTSGRPEGKGSRSQNEQAHDD